ncbi:MAG: hypothetical protein ACE5FY_07000, partial [Nitrospiria bacterium]
MFLIILKSRLKALSRELAKEWATYFLLGPVMVGVVILLGRRIFNDFAVDVGKIQQVSLTQDTIVRLTLVFLFLKVFFNFLPMAKRLYPTERSLTMDDLLPIDFSTRYQIFYLEQIFRDLPFFVVGLFLTLFVGNDNMLLWVFVIWLFFPGIEIGFTLTWIHFLSPDRAQLGAALLFFLFLIAILPVTQLGWWTDFFTLLLVPLGYYKGFKVWRYRDISHVETSLTQQEVISGRGQKAQQILRLVSRIAPPSIRTLVHHDLILLFRNFVPHFWRNFILSLLIATGTLVRGDVAPVMISAVSVFILASTVSPLFTLQRPFRISEKVLPLSSEQVWKTKIIVALILSFPIPWLIWGIEMTINPLPLPEALSLLMTLLLVSIAVASLVGGTICEGDQRPALQYIVAGMLSALATVFIAIFHPLLFLLLFVLLSHLKGSAMIRLEN